MIAVCGGNEIFDGPGAWPPRSWPTSVWRCSSLIGVSVTSTRPTPSGCSAAVTSFVIRSRNGQPSIVSQTSTRTSSPSTAIPRSIPMSSIGLPISGSFTPLSASRTCASVINPDLLAGRWATLAD